MKDLCAANKLYKQNIAEEKHLEQEKAEKQLNEPTKKRLKPPKKLVESLKLISVSFPKLLY
jgi:hypothetical protein